MKVLKLFLLFLFSSSIILAQTSFEKYEASKQSKMTAIEQGQNQAQDVNYSNISLSELEEEAKRMRVDVDSLDTDQSLSRQITTRVGKITDILNKRLVGGLYTFVFIIFASTVIMYLLIRNGMINRIKLIENKTITKIVIILTIFWIANSFLNNYISGHINVKGFLKDQVVVVIVYGYLWITNKLTLE